MSQNTRQKLKILALHGYMQNANKFREKTFPFQRRVKKYAEIIFISAPYKIPIEFTDKTESGDEAVANKSENECEDATLGDNNSIGDSNGVPTKSVNGNFSSEQGEDAHCFAWYLRHPSPTGYVYESLEGTLCYLEKVFEEQGPFDGVFGFSQGGCVVGFLCDLQQRNLLKHIKFDFAILASAFKYPRSDFYQEELSIPSMHIYGETDKQLSSDRSRSLIECFKNPVVVKHSGGHYVPGNSTVKKEYEHFLSEQWFRKFEIL